MISPLTVDDCRLAHLKIQTPLQMEIPFDEDTIGNIVRAHRALLQMTSDEEDHLRILQLVTQMVCACPGFAMFGGDLDSRFGIELADVWLSRNGYLLLPGLPERTKLFEVLTLIPVLPQPPFDSQLDAVRSWAARNIAEATSGITLAAKAGLPTDPHPLQCFLACPLTGIPVNEMSSLRELCDTAASVMSDYGILTFQPVLYTSPGITPVHINDPVYRSIDERLIATSQIVLVLAARPSLGLGVVASIAQRYRKHLIVGAPSNALTPMVTGLDPAPSLIRLDCLKEDLYRHLHESMPAIEAAAEQARGEITELEAELYLLRMWLDNLSTRALSQPRNIVMNRRRFRELINCAELFAGATVLELRELSDLMIG